MFECCTSLCTFERSASPTPAPSAHPKPQGTPRGSALAHRSMPLKLLCPHLGPRLPMRPPHRGPLSHLRPPRHQTPSPHHTRRPRHPRTRGRPPPPLPSLPPPTSQPPTNLRLLSLNSSLHLRLPLPPPSLVRQSRGGICPPMRVPCLPCQNMHAPSGQPGHVHAWCWPTRMQHAVCAPPLLACWIASPRGAIMHACMHTMHRLLLCAKSHASGTVHATGHEHVCMWPACNPSKSMGCMPKPLSDS